MNEERGVVPEALGETSAWTKSPFIQGFLAGMKGFMVGAPTGALVQALRGKSPLVGGIVGGLGAGLVTGIAKATHQKLENVSAEEDFRYHINQIKGREPFVFMPPPPLLRRAVMGGQDAYRKD